jgi:hypothetical protein
VGAILQYKNLENIGSMSNESTRQENLRKRMVGLGVTVMLFNVTFNIISFISWQSVLLMEEIRVPGKNLHQCVLYIPNHDDSRMG